MNVVFSQDCALAEYCVTEMSVSGQIYYLTEAAFGEPAFLTGNSPLSALNSQTVLLASGFARKKLHLLTKGGMTPRHADGLCPTDGAWRIGNSRSLRTILWGCGCIIANSETDPPPGRPHSLSSCSWCRCPCVCGVRVNERSMRVPVRVDQVRRGEQVFVRQYFRRRAAGDDVAVLHHVDHVGDVFQ